ncbi:flagellar assembly protein A [Salinibacillus xinjiangensis]|uniref:DUF342 domain-containing protein n=1 Tax=Salinibacillus xinjiangensis TaxID=1229268 RepID=A0A6G1X2B5_9BACI|nr:flagellar assembly protein A [Salinibacillus xinjiangensis]MRG85036.1 DUF342 domain-containing protein [Salinibacillus xinjiangensis]
MQNIISKGKNLKEAINIGLNLMDVSKKEVDIEVIQQEKNGFIGIGRKEAIVKISLNQKSSTSKSDEAKVMNHVTHTSEEIVEILPIDKDGEHSTDVEGLSDERNSSFFQSGDSQLEGKAWVNNNKIYVKDSPFHYPTVQIDKGVKLYKNGMEVQEKSTVISQNDQLDIKLDESSEKETSWQVSLVENGLKAILKVDPGFIVNHRIKDVDPDKHIDLVIEESREVHNSLEYEDVLKKLQDFRVIYGIQHNEIVQAINAVEPGEFVVAKGRSAHPGNHGWLDLKVDVNSMNGLVEDESGNVDFRETKFIPNVEKGQVIGIIYPPKPGIPGVTVTNEPLPAKQTYPLKIASGRGVIEVGDKLVATESGRPFIEQRGHLVKATILEKLIHEGDVNLSSGNIRFIGDVEIIGQVEENMTVDAGGDIFVHKSVSEADLTSSKAMVVKGNVINSELNAGKNNLLIAELGHLLGIMNKQLDKMIVFIQQLSQSPAFKSNDFSITGLQPLIMILLEKRFQNFIPYAKQYQEVVEKGENHLEEKEWVQIAVSLKQIFINLSTQVTTIDQLRNLSQKMKELSELSETPVEPDSYMAVAQAVNSRLYCSGDINVIGKGCLNTKIHSGGQLKVSGMVRGGEIYGKLGVSINEVGSNSGTKTIVSVPSDQKIHITQAFEGTLLRIGNKTHLINDKKNHLKAYLNQENELKLESL